MPYRITLPERATPAAEQPESKLGYTVRNVAQVPGRVVTGLAGAPLDILKSVTKDLGLPQKIQKLQVPDEVENNPFLLPAYLNQLQEAGQEMQFKPVEVIPGSKQLQEMLPSYLQPRQGDVLGAALSYLAPLGASRALGGLSSLTGGGLPALLKGLPIGVARTALEALGAYGGAQLGGVAGKELGGLVGFPETGQELGGAAGTIAGIRGAQKGLSYIKNIPTRTLPSKIQEKFEAQESGIEKSYQNALKNLEKSTKLTEKELGARKERLKDKYNQQLDALKTKKQEIESKYQSQQEQIKKSVEEQQGALEERKEKLPQGAEKFQELYDKYDKNVTDVLNKKYGGDVDVAVPNLWKRVKADVQERIKNLPETVQKKITRQGQQVLRAINEDGSISFKDARQRMKNLGKMSKYARSIYETPAPDSFKDAARSLRAIINEEITAGMERYPEVLSNWKKANQAYVDKQNFKYNLKNIERELTKEQKQVAAHGKTESSALQKEMSQQLLEEVKKPETAAAKEINKQIKEAFSEPLKELKQSQQKEISRLGRQRALDQAEIRRIEKDLIAPEGWKKRLTPGGIGYGIAELVTRALPFPGWVKSLMKVGGALAGEVTRQKQYLNKIGNYYPEVKADWRNAVHAGAKGNWKPMAAVIRKIDKGEQPQKGGRYRLIA